MVRVLTRHLPFITPVLFALGIGLGAASGTAWAAGPAVAPPDRAAADAVLVEAAGLAGLEQPPELWQCKVECLKAGREDLKACLAEPDSSLRACIERARAVVEACVQANCADIEPPCQIACLRAAHAEYKACLADGGTRRDCVARQREALKACLADRCGG